ncbi:3-hydroxy-9,10-secoandrosta-1,3,5(10)-triene-9,17-dione monooxygenase [Actinopolyspora lacussalsi subsp. righensis]|uniref:3-hydroxy-9,10-secoandrosta-1,3,5(10)-triene-9,17-dione monooxygenase n=1 Tax=Actinopolyspora righensis TaxID=995060 RepID=A0A1I6XD21_9ACTN|nr:acyl-CoA dehydrogenase family protein [Actinopolyspora righensis]SFT36205.1 3-hydroxy-9,10-secoandrosta-1,3,5(10)-triene-9,17-dione monooxygenase [Actinopolyspora righensis]
MTVANNISDHEFPLPPEPNLTPAEVIARAEAIAPSLVERQRETEQRTFYAPDTHLEFTNAGFYKILVPRRYGGYEFGIDTFLRVTMALARGCPSTGWMFCLGGTHALQVATLFDEPAQAELFSGGDFICPATIAPSGTAERAENGDWILNGTFAYCSGAPYATHFLGHTPVSLNDGEAPEPMLFVAPSSEWQRLDDWGNQLGLKGSGSHSIKFDNGRIADHFTLPATHMSEVDVTRTPGRVLHGNPEYGGGPLSFMLLEISALAVGMAKGALDAYEELMRTRTTLFPPRVTRAENSDYQWWYGQAAGMIATAEAAVLNAIRQWSDICALGVAEFTREQDLRLAMICREAIQLSWHAVEAHLFPTAGSSSVRQGERIERTWRDMSTMHSHSGIGVLLASVATRELAQARFGIN